MQGWLVRSFVVLATVILSAACGGADHAPSGAPSAGVPALAVAPMKLIAPKLPHQIEIKADGTVAIDGKDVWKVDGARLIEIARPGEPLIQVAADGTVTGIFLIDEKDRMKLNDHDELVAVDGTRFLVADDGSFANLSPEGKSIDANASTMKLVGFVPAARRASLLVVFHALMTTAFEQLPPEKKARLLKARQ